MFPDKLRIVYLLCQGKVKIDVGSAYGAARFLVYNPRAGDKSPSMSVISHCRPAFIVNRAAPAMAARPA